MSKFDLKKINIDGIKQKVKDIDIQSVKQNVKSIKNHKWCLIVCGIVMILLGLFSMFHSDETILSLVMLFGFGFVVSGIAHVFSWYLYMNSPVDHPRWFLAQGVYEIILGFIFIANLGVTYLSIPLMIAFWAIFDGVVRTTASYQWKKDGIEKWCILLASGIISIIFALLLLARPGATVFAATFMIGITLLAWGVTAAFEAYKLYNN
ncbi:MAG: DUF308 domain-containing protein [Synergistaceae bacterium]|nr:DUF308 domain-containing protein [Synergistaceae bacterium]